MTSCCFRIFFCLLPVLSYSQVVDEVLFQPGIKVSWNNNSRWSFNTSIEQRTSFDENTEALHIQLAQFAQYEIGFYSQLGIGMMYRELFDQERPEELRLTEQYVFAKKYNQFKLAHRLRWDQRLRDERTTHRWRYQLSGSIPLNGSQVDATEYYISAHAETLFIAENQRLPAYDQRVGIALGKQLGSSYKLQLETEYRWEDFTAGTSRLLFVNLSIYASL